jgi:hypothetical protein
MKAKRWSALLFGIGVAVLGAAPPSYACDSNNGYSAWYGLAWRQNGPIANGSYANVYMSGKGAADDQYGGHINNSLWNSVDGSGFIGEYWIEVGDTKGYEGTNDRTFYWARNVPNVENSYREHRVTSISPSVGGYMPLELLYLGNSTWGVYIDFQIQSSDNPVGGTYLYNTTGDGTSVAVGLESTSPYSYSAPTPSAGLDYVTSSGYWAGQFPNYSALWCDAPATSTWDSEDVQQSSSMN